MLTGPTKGGHFAQPSDGAAATPWASDRKMGSDREYSQFQDAGPGPGSLAGGGGLPAAITTGRNTVILVPTYSPSTHFHREMALGCPNFAKF